MKKILEIVLLIISSISLNAQNVQNKSNVRLQKKAKGTDGIQLQTNVHQPLTKDAYDLLRIQYPTISSSAMNNHVGISETSGPWTSEKIVAGAYREDLEEIVYNYDLSVLTETITHFWDADQGDLSTITAMGEDIENAYQKARVYIYGVDGWGNERIFINKNLLGFMYGWFLSYDSLFDLYKTGKYYINGYYNIGGQFVDTKYGPFYMSVSSRDTYVWEILGRVAHLLGDMGVPAHAHNDLHPLSDWYEDSYMNISTAINYNENLAYDYGGLIFAIDKSDPLKYLFYTTNQVADFFGSDDENGDLNYDSGYEELNEFYSLIPNPITYDHMYGVPSGAKIAEHAYIMSMRAIAGLLHWFAIETNMFVPPPPLSSVSISGPTYLSSYQTGTWTANPTGGILPYHYQWWYRYPSGGEKKDDDGSKKPPSGIWFKIGDDSPTISRYDDENFELKCDVTDAENTTKTAYKTVYVSSGAKSQLAKESPSTIENLLPEETKLLNNYPNPFNPTTTINYQLKENGFVTLKVYDILGKEVAELVNENKSAGYYNVTFNANNLTSGLYIYRLSVNGFVENKRMMLTK
ncbi:MAG: T9SS type A sorting domain-containing protein [Ignavibacteriae bacterium]|nr:T9SS type A sorting domain-containing protein [Ignavibacteriota bacterium]